MCCSPRFLKENPAMVGDWQSTACILCECNCGIVVQLDGRNLAKIRGDKDHPASQGYTCNKALRLDHYQNNGNRLTSPMRRRPDGSYEEIDWDTAISEIALGFKRIADTYLRVRPGTDAWGLAALAAVLVQEDLCNEPFLAEHVSGVEPVRDALRDVPLGEYAQRCGVDEELIRTAARRIAAADSVAVFEDLGIQQAPNSTLCSYLNKLLWILTGNFAKRGGQHLHSSFGPLFRHVTAVGRTPVTGAPVVGGLIPSNAVPQEILSDHPDRFRAMIVESSNPAHSLADSAACRAAFESLELMVVIDVAMTETARLATYVLPAASQYEKAESTFFNLEFPHNTFHLRHPLLEPLEGTLPEPEIWARLMRALGVIDEGELRPLRQRG